MLDTSLIVRNYLLYFVLPLWLVVGFADYLCHRKSRIESTSGLGESLIHLLMMTEIGIPVVLGLYLEINALIIALIIGAFVLHELTSLWDIAYALHRREVSVIEQHVHSYLAVIPFMVSSFVICLNWDQFLALFGFGSATVDYSLRLKQPQLSIGYHIGLGTAFVVFLAAPYSEEAWRCYWTAMRNGLRPLYPRGIETPRPASSISSSVGR